MNANYDLLNIQIERAEKLFRKVKCPHITYFERLYWSKHKDEHWRIMVDTRPMIIPLMDASIADRIKCAAMISGLFDQLIKTKAAAITEAGKEAAQLQVFLDALEKKLIWSMM